MAINIGADADDEVMSQINTTPLVDVMLVLLIIFLITIPVVTTSVKVDLPKERNQVRETRPENLIVSVDANGQIYLYDTPVRNVSDLVSRLRPFADQPPQPEVQVRGDASSRFEAVGHVLTAVRQSGMAKVGLVTEPAE